MSKQRQPKNASVITKSTTTTQQEEKESALEIPFYSYSIKLTSFLNLYREPIIKEYLDRAGFIDTPFIQVAVLGQDNVGKTSLINDISRQSCNLTQPNATIKFNDTSPDTIYFKSVITNKQSNSNALFIRAPSLNHSLPRINRSQLLFDRNLMKKFVVGYCAWFSNILLIVVDSTSEKDYEQYYIEIKAMKHTDNRIFIVHNISKETDEGKARLFKRLDNNSLYNKSNFLNFSSESSPKIIEYYYVNKKDSAIIHLIYHPKTSEELEEAKDEGSYFKENNTSMIHLLKSILSTTTPQEKRKVNESFDKYFTAFARQLYENLPQTFIESTERETKLIEDYTPKLLTETFVDMNVFPLAFTPSFTHQIKVINDKECLDVYFDIPVCASFTKSNTNQAGGYNVIQLLLTMPTVNIACDKSYLSCFKFGNIPQGEMKFKINISNNYCIILNTVKPRKEIRKGRIALIYDILEKSNEEPVSFI